MGNRKTRIGQVISDKMEKTVVVVVETKSKHPLYRKTVSYARKYKAHDEGNTCRVGDVVKVIETRPFSKGKHWRVEQVLSRGEITGKELAESKKDDSELYQA
jgi:small subunit ribosomal protein S17